MVYKFESISKCRDELMGYAIFGVFLSHLLYWLGIKIPGVNMVLRLIYTQGFLFLSGFGLYYSFVKSSDILPFYARRMKRLYIPFVVMTFIPFLVYTFLVGNGIVDFVSFITTIHFWTHGSYLGMWYIAVSIALYFIYPILHKYIFLSNKGVALRAVSCLLLAVVFFEVLKYTPFFETFGFWAQKAIVFPLGMLCGYLSRNGVQVKIRFLIVWCIVMLVLTVVIQPYDRNYYDICKTCIALPIMCLLFEKFAQNKIRRFFSWFGKLSLEIYVLHCVIYGTMIQFYPPYKSILVAYPITILLAPLLHKYLGKILDGRH